ncbi:IucA/IucC family protein [Streptomyces sp. 4N509B]|uniref:IucA/IucC family protein n=1 Tax=Streptomyces sp. 4N509B TaxID=3457413 RepID=UPI003FCFD0A7
MTASSRRDRGPARERQPSRHRLTRLAETAGLRQPRHAAVTTAPEPAAAGAHAREGAHEPADPLDHPDADRAADAAGVENLLRCWLRERGIARPADGCLRLALAASGVTLLVPVLYWSATGWHRFGRPVLAGAAPRAAAVDAVTLAVLLAREAAAPSDVGGGGGGTAGGGGGGGVVDLAGRVADSVRRTGVFLAARRTADLPTAGRPPFLLAEQSLVLGHPLHPTPKSREGLAGAEARSFSPELGGAFRLHWMAVHRSVLAADSAWREDGATVPAPALAARLAGGELALPPDTVPLPLHPWQAREVTRRSAVARLLADGRLHDLGEHGEPWYPTSSVRTVHQPGAPAMLKLSLGLDITNSRRENLRKELHRGVEVHRLLSGGLAGRRRDAFGRGHGFDVLRDPAWLGVNDEDGRPLPGMDVVLRQSPFGPEDDVTCVAALTTPRPWPGQPKAGTHSRLARLVGALADRAGRSTSAVAVEWLLRYLRVVVEPVLWLDAEAGVALEAHQQNTLVLLDADGWPAGGWYRDNQGYYFRASHRDALQRRLPGIGDASDTFVTDAVATERFAYYLAINNVFGLIGALGSERLAEEELLIAAFRRFLGETARGGGPVSPLTTHLLESPTLRCKANLLTRIHGLDELVGPVDGQSVYVTIRNPLAAR